MSALEFASAFDFQSRTRFVVGAGELSRLGSLAKELDARRVLLVSDPGVVRAGHAPRAEEYLRQAGVEVVLFDGVEENPTGRHVNAGCECARQFAPDCIIGVGGGSSLDCAKGINFVYSNGGAIQDYWGIGKATLPMLPMIAVPTTAGTGSEAQSFALISDEITHVKMACGDKKASFRIALLDPTLTVTQPRHVTSLTGIDAFSHALETFVTRPANPASRIFSWEAWQLLAQHLPRVVCDPENLQTRAALQWGACLAGMAIENSMLGAAHALANPLTSQFGIPHGQAVAVMLPHVIDANASVCGNAYQRLYSVLSEPGSLSAIQPSVHTDLAMWVQSLVAHLGLSYRLKDLPVEHSALPRLAELAGQQWTARFNPRELAVPELGEIYERAWSG